MSFEELTERISPKLKGIIYKIHRPSHSLSEDDLYQEAILQLWYDYQDGKLSDKTDSYILQGCYFYLKNYMRKFQDETSLMSANMPIHEGGAPLQELLPLKEEVSLDEDTNIDDLMEKVRGYIPIATQMKLERLSNGALKADLKHCGIGVDDDRI